MEDWSPPEDDELLRISDAHFPNFVVIAHILNMNPASGGLRRSPRQCQERYQALNQRRNQAGGAGGAGIGDPHFDPRDPRGRPRGPVVRYLMQAGALLHASWPPHRNEEGITPSVLPVKQVEEVSVGVHAKV